MKMTHPAARGLIVLLTFIAACAPQRLLGATYDLDADFSTASNPNGVWSYGWKSVTTGPLTLNTLLQDPGSQSEQWNFFDSSPPSIYHNGTSLPLQSGTVVLQPGATWLEPGVDNSTQNFAGVRFTVPTNGSGPYSVNVSASPYLGGTDAGDSDFHVIWNSVEVFGQFLAAGAGTNYAAVLTLQAGDTIDFLCGRGADGHLFGSGLKIEAVIAPTNTPGVYDLSKQFGTGSNPNGVWSYGFESSIGGPLVSYTNSGFATGDNGASFELWSLPGLSPSAVYHNASSNTVVLDAGAGVFPPGSTWFVPGLDGAADNYGAVRFTVPTGGGGFYALQTAVQPYLAGPLSGDSDFHILANGVELFGESLSPSSGTGYTNFLPLASGETVDFLVGRGADGHFAGSGLIIQAQIAAPSIVISPRGGYFTNQVAVTMQAQPANSTIYYTLDGSAPTNTSAVYSGSFLLTNAATVTAQAFLAGQPVTSPVSQSYARVYVTDNLIPVSWLVQYFGSNYLTSPNAASTADPDGDGQDNYQEYLAGTNPLDATSALKIGGVYLAPVIAWASVSKVTYIIQRSSLLNTTNWVNIGSVTATNSSSVFVDTSVTSTNILFYRLEVQAP